MWAVHWLYWNSRTWSSSIVIVMTEWRTSFYVASVCFQNMLYFKRKTAEFNGEQEKNISFVRG